VLKRWEILNEMGRVEEVEEAEAEAKDMVGPLGECWFEFVGLLGKRMGLNLLGCWVREGV
jgi:hypothetical protein